MTWQKVNACKDSKEASFKIADGQPTPDEMGMEPAHGQAAEINLKGLFLELESKSGNVYDFNVAEDMTVDFLDMAEDIMAALADDAEVWVDVDFDANGGDGRVLYWAEGAPWDGGEVHDDYGIMDGY
jgi:hypothetical protein